MKTTSFQNILDQNKLPSHILIAFLSLIISAVVTAINQPSSFVREEPLHLFFLLLIQIELFIFLGSRIFKGLKPPLTRSEFTKAVLSKLVLFLVLCFILAFATTLLYTWLINAGHGNPSADAVFLFKVKGFSGWLKGTIGGLLFGIAVFIYFQWQEALSREQKLREKNLIFQNETLKNQINPHFLFNSLNTLSSLISSQPDAAEKFIGRLSSIYRYILENSASDSVSLADELSFVNDYFYLHQIRGEGKTDLEINIEDPGSFRILPISLQGLVENAIKHNRATRSEPLKITIYTEGRYIAVSNNLQKMATQMPSTGIGLKNLSERVRLVSGSDLIIEESDSHFIVKMPLLS